MPPLMFGMVSRFDVTSIEKRRVTDGSFSVPERSRHVKTVSIYFLVLGDRLFAD